MWRTSAGPVLVVLTLLAAGGPARGQETDEVKRLKEHNAALESRLKQAEAQIERLKAENARLAGEKKKLPLTDLLPAGTALTGDSVSTAPGGNNQPATVVVNVTERDGNKMKGTWVATNAEGKTFPERQLEGTIDGAKLTFRSVGTTVKFTVTLALKGDSSLEGIRADTDGGRYKVGLRIGK